MSNKQFTRMDPRVIGGGGPKPNYGPGINPYVQPSAPEASTAPANVFPVQAADYLNAELGVEPSTFRDDDGFLALTAPEVLCNRCTHGFIVKSRAPVQNKKPDGTPFHFIYGQCMRTTPPMPLDDLRVEECNQFAASEDEE